MASLVLNPSVFVSYGATSGNASIQNQTNPVGKSSSNTTYATLTTSTTRSATSYAFWKFDCSSIPSNAIIESVSCVAKCYVNNTSRISTRSVQLYYGTSTAKGSSVSFDNSTNATQTLNCGTWTREELNDINIRVAGTRGTSTNSASIRFYGADLTVTYTIPQNYTVTTTITNGVLVNPSASEVVVGGSDLEFFFRGNDKTKFMSMKVNGAAVTVTKVAGQNSSAATWTPSTNYGTYNNNAITNVNGDNSTYFWSNEAQSVGKYILFTFNKFINLTEVTTYSSNSTDYPRSVNKLQVSSDNTNWVDVGTFQNSQTSTFTGINATKIKYVRIYCDTGGTSNWLVLNSVTFTYTVPVIEEGYSYTLSNIDGDKTVEITFINTNRILLKVNGEYKEGTAYKKTSGRWTAVTPKELSDYLKDKKIKKKI